MINNKKWIFSLIVLVAVVVAVGNARRKKSALDFDYLAIQCGIYDREGHPAYLTSGHDFCDFSSVGVIHRGHDVVKANGTVLLTNYLAHHDFKVSADGQSVLQIQAVFHQQDGNKVKSDCVIRKTLSGDVTGQWCLKDHLADFARAGYFITPKWKPNFWKPQEIIQEISHANSIYEIPDNSLEKTDPIFSKGNYLFNLYGQSNLIVVLDRDLKTVLKVFNMNEFPLPRDYLETEFPVREGKRIFGYQRIETHDDQVTNDGMILSYATVIGIPMRGFAWGKRPFVHIDYNEAFRQCRPGAGGDRTIVLKWSPLNPKKAQVIWASAPLRTKMIRGWASELKNGNYLISHFDGASPEIFVVNKDGEKIWTSPMPANAPRISHRAKPIYDNSILESVGVYK